jgi:glutamine synthetase
MLLDAGIMARGDPGSCAAVRELMRSRRLLYADLRFAGLDGRLRRATIPADAVTEALFREGLPMAGREVAGWWDGVMLIFPDVDAVFPESAAAPPTLAVMCEVRSPHARQPAALDPRRVLRRAQAEACERFQADIIISADPGIMLHDGDGRTLGERAVFDFLRVLAMGLWESKVPVDWFKPGPALGQGRVQLRPGRALPLADRVVLCRHAALGLARKRGLAAALLPRPVPGGDPGLPGRTSAWEAGGGAAVERLGRGFTGGLRAHLPALLAFCVPDASAGQRRGFCSPTSAANPYLAVAAVIMAGLDGIERGFEGPGPGALPNAVGGQQTLESAIRALDGDRDFLRSAGVFTDGLIEAWLELLRERPGRGDAPGPVPPRLGASDPPRSPRGLEPSVN